MRGLLFYDSVGAKRNEWFIARLIESAKDRGLTLDLVIKNKGDDLALPYHPDFAIVRAINPALSEHLEALGIKVFNNSLTARIANDKWQTYLFARELGIRVMPTEAIISGSDVPDFTDQRVVKSVDGHGGSEVFLVNNLKECKEILSLHQNKRFISQPLSSEPGVDMRVYMLGSTVLAAVKRTSRSDFRSNFSLGGNAELVQLPPKTEGTVATIIEALGCDLVGIDFIRHDGEWVLNEIEDVVGTRMLYALTDIDAADEYIAHIVNRMKP